MAKANRTCYACGKQYYYCPTCDDNGETWQIMFDCKECQQAFTTISDYNGGGIDASMAKDRLLEIPNFKIENYRESIQKVAKEVLNDVPSDIIEQVVETSSIEEVKTIETEEIKEVADEVVKPITEEVKMIEESPITEKKITTVNQSKKRNKYKR